MCKHTPLHTHTYAHTLTYTQEKGCMQSSPLSPMYICSKRRKVVRFGSAANASVNVELFLDTRPTDIQVKHLLKNSSCSLPRVAASMLGQLQQHVKSGCRQYNVLIK